MAYFKKIPPPCLICGSKDFVTESCMTEIYPIKVGSRTSGHPVVSIQDDYVASIKEHSWVLVWILSLMQRETSSVSKWAGNPAEVVGSPGRILSTNCLWLTRHGRETVWSTKLSQKLSLWGCLYKRWSCYFWQKIFNTEMFFLNGEFVTSNFTSITLISKLHGFHIPQISLGYWSENHVLIYFVLRHYFHLNSI